MVTYTVLDKLGQPIGRNLSPPHAAHLVLTHDGGHYDIRQRDDGAGFVLWIMARDGPAMASSLVSTAADIDSARDELFDLAIAANRKEHGLTVVEDADYELWLSGFENE